MIEDEYDNVRSQRVTKLMRQVSQPITETSEENLTDSVCLLQPTSQIQPHYQQTGGIEE